MSPARILLLIMLLAAPSMGQFTRIVGVTGTSQAGTSFALTIDAAPLIETIDFLSLAVDYSPLAMAQLMVLRINEHFRDDGRIGFEASLPLEATGKSKYDATFVLNSPNPINSIIVGTIGGPGAPAPKTPGIGFNPNLVDHQGTVNSPWRAPNPGDQATAQLRINQQNPALDFFRNVKVMIDPGLAPSPLDFEFSTGPNTDMGILFLTGPLNLGLFQTPWGDVLDLGNGGTAANPALRNITIIADGIAQSTGNAIDAFFRTGLNNPATYNFTLGVPPMMQGSNGPAFQAIVTDPSNSLPLRTTQVGNAVFEFGREIRIPIGSDGVAPVTLAVPGRSFDFYGQAYTQAFVHENGVLTFQPPGVFPAAPSLVDPSFALNDAPNILVNWGDWDLSSATAQQPASIELHSFGDEFRISWGDADNPISHFGDGDRGYFELTLIASSAIPSANAGAIMIDYGRLDGVAARGNDSVIGISPGMGLDPQARSRDLGRPQIADSTFGALLGQENRFGTLTAVNALPVGASVGGPAQVYSNGSAMSSRILGFYPPTGVQQPLNRYTSLSTDAKPDDFIGVAPGTPNLSVNPQAGGETIVLVGYFRFLDATSQAPAFVGVQNSSGQTAALSIVGVMDDSGTVPNAVPVAPGFRDFEGLVVQNNGLPGFAPGQLVDLVVGFPVAGQPFVISVPGVLTTQ